MNIFLIRLKKVRFKLNGALNRTEIRILNESNRSSVLKRSSKIRPCKLNRAVQLESGFRHRLLIMVRFESDYINQTKMFKIDH